MSESLPGDLWGNAGILPRSEQRQQIKLSDYALSGMSDCTHQGSLTAFSLEKPDCALTGDVWVLTGEIRLCACSLPISVWSSEGQRAERGGLLALPKVEASLEAPWAPR